jgi:hypothetical protein
MKEIEAVKSGTGFVLKGLMEAGRWRMSYLLMTTTNTKNPREQSKITPAL